MTSFLDDRETLDDPGRLPPYEGERVRVRKVLELWAPRFLNQTSWLLGAEALNALVADRPRSLG